jgi:hypothetical protein
MRSHDDVRPERDHLHREFANEIGIPPCPSDGVAHQPSLTYCFFHSSADIGLSLTP